MGWARISRGKLFKDKNMEERRHTSAGITGPIVTTVAGTTEGSWSSVGARRSNSGAIVATATVINRYTGFIGGKNTGKSDGCNRRKRTGQCSPVQVWPLPEYPVSQAQVYVPGPV